MSKASRFGSTVSFAVVASLLAGCATSHGGVTSASGFGGKSGGEVGLATRALASLNANNVPAAIDFAERAVARTPSDAGFRALLGNAYFAGGRFASAEAAYKDALAIYPNQPRVVLKLALVEIAQGKTAEASAFLDTAHGLLDASDYGLALALAGRASEAIPTLDAAARQQGADSRVRQNLALAYAFAGDWTNARVIAAQDVPANQLDSRIRQWMQLAKPAHPSDQIAALTGVTPVAVDPGQPVRLALRRPDTQVAQAAPVRAPAPTPIAKAAPIQAPAPQFMEAAAPPTPQFVEAVAVRAPASQPIPAIAPAPPPARKRPAVIAEASPAPVTIGIVATAAADVRSVFAAFMPAPVPTPKPKAAKVRRAAAPAPAPRRALQGTTGAVVQLGAYSSPQRVGEAWAHLTQRYPALGAYLPMRARFVSPKGTFWRLSISGFDTQREAIARCQLLRSRGGSCFVRRFAGDAPVQYASR